MHWPLWMYRLTDSRDPWTSNDKEAHFFGAGMCYALADARQWPAKLITGGLILLIEAIEGIRWQLMSPLQRAMVEDGRKKWPWMCDRVSLKDMIVGIAGAAITAWVLP